MSSEINLRTGFSFDFSYYRTLVWHGVCVDQLVSVQHLLESVYGRYYTVLYGICFVHGFDTHGFCFVAHTVSALFGHSDIHCLIACFILLILPLKLQIYLQGLFKFEYLCLILQETTIIYHDDVMKAVISVILMRSDRSVC
jgi:hypothetical protein